MTTIQLQGAYRGDGVGYLEIIDAPSHGSIALITAEGVSLPVTVVSCDSQTVVVFPLVYTAYMTLVFPETGASRKITVFELKLRSKMGYFLRRSHAMAVRDCDLRTQDASSVRFIQVVESGDEAIVRVQIDLAENTAGLPVDLHIIDERGNVLAEDDVRLFRLEDCPEALNEQGFRCRRLIVSLKCKKSRLPVGLVACCNKSEKSGGVNSGADDASTSESIYARLDGLKQVASCMLLPDTYEALRAGFAHLTCNAMEDSRYQSWWLKHRVTAEALQEQAQYASKLFATHEPCVFSIVVPLYKTPLHFFDQMYESVTKQSYPYWELVLVNASQDDEVLGRRLARIRDARVKIVCAPNEGIAQNTNIGIEMAGGSYVCFLDHDDTLAPDALFEYARAVAQNPEIDLLYCDEDRFDDGGIHHAPFFKPDFSPELLRAHNYITHLLCISKRRISEIGLMDARYNGAQDYDYTLRASEDGRVVAHVPRVLYHWRLHLQSTSMNPNSKDYAKQAGRLAVQAHCNRLGFNADVEPTRYPFAYQVKPHLSEDITLDIVIPNKDQVNLLKSCVESLQSVSSFQRWNLIIVENNSTDDATFEFYRELCEKDERIQVVTWPGEGFNYSEVVNCGAAQGKSEFILFLNNDTEIIEPDSLEYLLGSFVDESVGVVGAKLLFSDGTVQHAGVGLGINGGAEHLFVGLPAASGGYFERACLPQNLSAVTGACQMVRRSVYEQVEGYNPDFRVGYNDVDFCCKVIDAGYRCVYQPAALLYHFEFASRGRDMTAERQKRVEAETILLKERWPRYFVEGDPYLNPNISRKNSYFCLKEDCL